jgi:peptide/nickel transport system substrate-binding protein
MGAVAAALVIALCVSACGSSKKSAAKITSATVLFGTAPDSLDPGMGYSTQALEPDQTAYIPMVTYAHQPGAAGGTLIPGLATALPTVSPDGKTYTMTMRKGLVYSNGKPVKASDQDSVGRIGCVPDEPDRRRPCVREGQGQDDLRHHDR